MKYITTTILISTALLVLASIWYRANADLGEFAVKRPIVVELFTSQGCSSCPPADHYLGELADSDAVLALSYHVDYWNYIGWKDPFSSADYTLRQRLYNGVFRNRSIYTPQMVIDGRFEAVGSNRLKVNSYIKSASEDLPYVPIDIVHDEAGGFTIDIAKGVSPGARANVAIIAYDDKHVTAISRGENHGRTLTNSNVVRDFQNIAKWSGGVLNIKVDPGQLAESDNVAVILQDEQDFRILSAATIKRR